jgi:hypothetical protein
MAQVGFSPQQHGTIFIDFRQGFEMPDKRLYSSYESH